MQSTNAIAKALNKYRLQREWTFRQLAAASGIPVPTLHGIIKYGQRPSELTAQKIKNRLPGLDIEDSRCADCDSAN